MAYQIEIKILGFPPAGTTFGFTVRINNAVLLQVAKVFGASGSANTIVPGSSLTTAVTAVRNNLAANNAAAGVVYTVVGNSVIVTLPAGAIIVQDNVGTPDYVSVYLLDPEVQGMAAVNIYNVSIEIIDTYDNGRSLLEEYTQPSSPKLVWDGGDDIYSPMMPSNLVFNMAVADAADAKFLHLLTGDEKRYLVKVRNTDTHDVTTLLWQGYILPDLYSEPWKSGVPFVEFTVIDMLASLKTKEFAPWFYQNTFNVPELFGYILAETGLQQEMYFTPCLVNVDNPNYRFRDLNISLLNFTDGKKNTKLYEILEKLLTALGLCIYSYRGKWFLEGITRRFETRAGAAKTVAEVFYPDGVFKQTTGVSHKTVSVDYIKEVPTLTAKTPWKKVSLNFSNDSEGLYPEGVVVKDYMSTDFVYDNKSNTTFSDNYMDNWTAVGAPYMRDAVALSLGLSHELELRINSAYWNGTNNYNVTETMARASYFDCKIKPYAAKQRIYELEYEVQVDIETGYEDFEKKLDGKWYDGLVCFQLFNGNDEIFSHRPTFVGLSLVVFERSIINAGDTNLFQTVLFKVKYKFTVANSNYLSFRILPGIAILSNIFVNSFILRPKKLQITTVEEIEDNESAIAVRDINYTQEVDEDIDITCTADGSVKASFGIGARSGNRFIDIPVQSWVDFATIQMFLPSTNVGLDLRRWPISKFLQDYIFSKDNQKSVFFQRAGQKQIEYNSIYTWLLAGVPYMAVYKGYTVYSGNQFATPNLPKGYKPLPGALQADKLTLMASLFPIEDKSLRAKWKITGFPDATANTLMRTLARAYHAVRPSDCFMLEATALDLVFPEHRPVFVYKGENRVFVPTRIEMDITAGKTGLTAVEWKLQNVNDISYE